MCACVAGSQICRGFWVLDSGDRGELCFVCLGVSVTLDGSQSSSASCNGSTDNGYLCKTG